jgi:FlaA1/EpsC-like NDP-sugar epimerase
MTKSALPPGLLARLSRHVFARTSRSTGTRLLIIGAGEAGRMVVKDILRNPDGRYAPIGFLDDSPTKAGLRIEGVPVLGTLNDLAAVLTTHQPDELLVAMPSAAPGVVRSIVSRLEHYKIPIKTLPRLRDIIAGHVEVRDIRTLALEDLLAREPIGLDPAPLQRLIAGRRVLVTGAGGSIGGELCRQIAEMEPESLVMLDRYENGLHGVVESLRERSNSTALRPVIADVTDAARIDAIFARYRPQIVFHAAAHKHVPLMEDNPCEAIKNNVTGTRLVVEAADRHKVDRFILVSTDKAINPTSMMGASKRLAELVVQAVSANSRTTFAIVRFGNVLGSNGSVIPRFLEQIRSGGPVTVTHPEVRRFFMLIPEAVQLVLHAAAQAENGATYLLEMGEQVKVLDMARHLIRLCGFVPDEDVKIKFVGLRPGEKLSEELIGRDETTRPSRVEKILRVIDTRPRPNAEALVRIGRTERSAAVNDVGAVTALLTRLIPGYSRPESLVPVTHPDGTFAAVRTATEPAPPRLVQQECPSCRARALDRSQARTIIERMARAVGEKRLFTCKECRWRGWLTPLEVGIAARVASLRSPDLNAVDAAVDLIPFVASRAFSPHHLS